MNKPLIIAELGWSHGGNKNIAKEMIQAAAENGADFVKFQTWSEDKLRSGPWDHDGRREIYKQAQLSESDHEFYKNECERFNVKFLTSCFYHNDLSFIKKVSPYAVKIPSTECSNSVLVSSAIGLFDTVFLSTGASLPEEVEKWASLSNVIPMHCVASYPCPAGSVNLPRLKWLSTLNSRFGYSGHYFGIEDAVAAVALGACVIEKHFTIDRNLPGRDNKFSLLPNDLQELRYMVDEIWLMNQDKGVNFQDCEREMREIYRGRWSGDISNNSMQK